MERLQARGKSGCLNVCIEDITQRLSLQVGRVCSLGEVVDKLALRVAEGYLLVMDENGELTYLFVKNDKRV